MRSQSNAGNVPSGLGWTTHESSMRAFDKLPKVLRNMLAHDVTYDMSAEEVLEIYQEYGLARAIKEVRES